MMFDLRQAPTPFAMRPGLAKLGPDARHLHPLIVGSRLHAEKLAAAQHANACLVDPRLDEAALQALWRTLLAQRERDGIATPFAANNPAFPAGLGQKDLKNTPHRWREAFLALAQCIEEDFALLDARPDAPVPAGLPLLCVACPSHWAPEAKIGQSLAEVHAPVADGELLRQATSGLVALATRGDAWERWVWTITPSPHFDAHPSRHPARIWPPSTTPAAFAQACFLRAERQTFLPVLDDANQPTGLAAFTIRVMLHPLPQAVPTPAHAQALHASLASMSEAVLDYKGLTSAKEPLLRWLQGGACRT
jgi:dimethylamine monooxygenase subunit A